MAEPDCFEIDAERYELFEGPLYRFELDRRDFLQTFGSGLVVLLIAPRLAAGQESGRGFGAERVPNAVVRSSPCSVLVVDTRAAQ